MKMFGLNYIKDVATLQLVREKCNGCRQCTIVCPHHVFVMENKKAKIINLDACMECGACAVNCTENAISVKAGVGCASAVINTRFKKNAASGEGCCCCEETRDINCC